jgi:predicted HicB family RNase H-like nuclease
MPRGPEKMTLTIRTSKELHRWLKAEAKRNGRSLNQEVEARLLHEKETGEAKPILDELRALLAKVKK